MHLEIYLLGMYKYCNRRNQQAIEEINTRYEAKKANEVK